MTTITKAKAADAFFAAQRSGNWQAASLTLAAFFTPKTKNGRKRWSNSLATARQGLGINNPVIQTVFADGYGVTMTRWQHRFSQAGQSTTVGFGVQIVQAITEIGEIQTTAIAIEERDGLAACAAEIKNHPALARLEAFCHRSKQRCLKSRGPRNLGPRI